MNQWRGREEILDTRGRSGPDRPRPAPRELPPVDLGGAPADGSPATPAALDAGIDPATGAPDAGAGRRRLTQWVAASAVLAFLAGAAVGGSTVDARREAAASAQAVDDARVAAVVQGIDGGARQGVVRIAVALRNLGERDLTVVSLYPEAWVVVEEEDRELPLPAGQWVNGTMRVVPDCGAPVPSALVARVSNGERQRLLTLPLPAGSNPLAWARQEACSLSPADLFVTSVDVLGESESGLRTRLILRGGSPVSTLVSGASSRTPGFEVVVVDGLPATVRGGGLTNRPVLLSWRVTDCAAAESLGSADIAFDVKSESDGLPVSVQSLDPRVTAALARYALTTCGAPAPG